VTTGPGARLAGSPCARDRAEDGADLIPGQADQPVGVLLEPDDDDRPGRLDCQPKDRARRVAPWLTGFPADLPSSSSQASQRSVIQSRSAQSAPMSALSEFMNWVPPPSGRSTSLGASSTGMSRAFISRLCLSGCR
jgi:hypothetical protein